ncbi:spore gernimation protein [Lysinibacillus yapensis]|uniref:Spore gernimation protein n=1 Tax=Ureibacillus yapensis TaxID=2304605 RepID=A0A396S6Q9_9BACL|nr:endospore germination permease [Lysinibacillus yapensis]RHW35799.1 spore gernimation protein [Lysinibacillus yapensis]
MKLQSEEGFISDRDIMIAVISNIIGLLTLTLPRLLAANTNSSDGWLAIVLGGGIVSFFAYIVSKIASSFPNQSFFSYASYLVSKPLAVFFTLMFTLQYLAIASFQVREISVLAHQYLFDQTPREVIALAFLLVVIYAVSGSHAAIFRLNVLFLPIIIGGLLILILLPLGFIRTENLLPVFQTDIKGYLKATYSSITSFMGFGIVLFYIALVKSPENTPKMAVRGVLVITFLNLLLYIVCIGVLGNLTTENLFFPSFDLSRTVDIPGGFFQRFDSILFVVWTMIIFTTALMAFDIAVMTLMMVFEKLKKIKVIFTLSPILFFISMLPKDYLELTKVSSVMSSFIVIYLVIVTILLGVAYKIKGGNQNA